MAQIYCSQIIPAPKSAVFKYLADLDQLDDMLADHIDIEVLERPQEMQLEAEFELQMTRYGLSQKVRARVTDYIKDKRITYTQRSGLFQAWSHAQVFESTEEGYTKVTDVVNYDLPFSLVGHILSDLFVKKDMTRILETRLQNTSDYFEFKQNSAVQNESSEMATAAL